jgi:leucyl-tRNA synthetase
MILGEDNQKMSKSRGNVVNPDEIVAACGADAFRLYEMFMGPLEATKPWKTTDIVGISRFLDRVWRLAGKRLDEGAGDDALVRNAHKMVKKVTEDIEELRFNTAVSAMMVFSNDLARLEAVPRVALETLTRCLNPFAPHLAEELWERLGHPPSLTEASWPSWDEALTRDDLVEVVVQVNGKVRARLHLPPQTPEPELEALARANQRVQELLTGKIVRKAIVVRGKLVNLVTG